MHGTSEGVLHQLTYNNIMGLLMIDDRISLHMLKNAQLYKILYTRCPITLSSRAALGLWAECVARAKIYCIQYKIIQNVI